MYIIGVSEFSPFEGYITSTKPHNCNMSASRSLRIFSNGSLVQRCFHPGGSPFNRFATTSNHLSRSTIDVYAYTFGSISVEKSPAELVGSQRQRHSMNIPVAPILHVVRLNVLENEAVWRL